MQTVQCLTLFHCYLTYYSTTSFGTACKKFSSSSVLFQITLSRRPSGPFNPIKKAVYWKNHPALIVPQNHWHGRHVFCPQSHSAERDKSIFCVLWKGKVHAGFLVQPKKRGSGEVLRRVCFLTLLFSLGQVRGLRLQHFQMHRTFIDKYKLKYAAYCFELLVRQ